MYAGGKPARTAGLVVFGVAVAVRLFFLLKIPGDYILPSTEWEIDSIAFALLESGGFADPYVIPTGPTAHLPPLAPFLLAGTFKVFGTGLMGGYVAWAVQILLQSAVWGLLPWTAHRLKLDWRAGLIGGLGGAMFPIWLGHGEAPAALLLLILVVALVHRWEQRERGLTQRPMASLLLGAGFGLTFHAQPALLPVFLGYLAYELWRRTPLNSLASTSLVLLGAVVISLPWAARNYIELESLFFVRSNFGLELHMGNHHNATASIDDPHFERHELARTWSHPRIDIDDAIEVRDSGEIAYMRGKGREAASWIAENPRTFIRLTLERFGHFWLGPLGQPGLMLLFALLTGLAIAGASSILPGLPLARAALLIPLLTYPIVYYLVPWQHRYRFPVEWILYLLAGAALVYLGRRLGLTTPGR
jgi:hypothetical protein